MNPRQSIQLILLVIAFLGMWSVTASHAQGFERSEVRHALPFDGAYYLGGADGYNLFENPFAGGTAIARVGSWFTQDLTGDGFPDFVVTGANSPYHHTVLGLPDQHWRVYPGDGQAFASQFIAWNLPDGGRRSLGTEMGYFHSTNAAGLQNDDEGSEVWHVRDMNGDAMPDLVVTSEHRVPYWQYVFRDGAQAYWKVYLNQGGGFEDTALHWSVPDGGWGINVTDPGFAYPMGIFGCTSQYTGQSWDMQDLDGDGDDDLVVTAECGYVLGVGTQPYWLVYRNTGAGFEQTAIHWSVPLGGEMNYVGLPLGFTSLALPRNSASHHGTQVWKVMDIDGDQLLDLVVCAERDSIAGLVTFGTSVQPEWRVFRGLGTGFDSVATAWPLPVASSVPAGANYFDVAWTGFGTPDSEAWATEDINADGAPDLIVTSQGLYSFGLDGNPYWKVYFNTGTGFSSNMYPWQMPYGGTVQFFSAPTQQGYTQFRQEAQDYFPFCAESRSWDLKDMNADGRMDFVCTGVKANYDDPAHVWEIYSGNTHWKVYLNTANPVGAEDIDGPGTLTIFPNPAHGVVQVDLRSLDGGTYSLRVHDLKGRLLHSTTLVTGQAHSIDVSGWSSGLYIVEVQTRKGKRTQKLVVE